MPIAMQKPCVLWDEREQELQQPVDFGLLHLFPNMQDRQGLTSWGVAIEDKASVIQVGVWTQPAS